MCENSKISSVSDNGCSDVFVRSRSWRLPDPAHASNYIFLADDLNSELKRLGNPVLHPVVLVPDFEPILRNGLSDGHIGKLVCRIRKTQHELKLR